MTLSCELLRLLDAYEECDSAALADLMADFLFECDDADPSGSAESAGEKHAVRRFWAGLWRYLQGAEAADRMTLVGPPEYHSFFADYEALPDSYKEMLRRVSKTSAADPGQRAAGRSPVSPMLDQHFCREVLGRVPKMVKRAERFDKLAVSGSVPKAIRDLFAEAHSCFIYGFPFASAVLCRSLTEAALNDRVDPAGGIAEPYLDASGRPTASRTRALAREAVTRGIIDGERLESIEKIRIAGNAAVHDPADFVRAHRDRVADILDHTRKVIEDLYSESLGGPLP